MTVSTAVQRQPPGDGGQSVVDGRRCRWQCGHARGQRGGRDGISGRAKWHIDMIYHIYNMIICIYLYIHIYIYISNIYIYISYILYIYIHIYIYNMYIYIYIIYFGWR